MASGEFNHLPQAMQALHDGLVLAIREATKGVRDGYAGYVAVDTGFTKASAYLVTSDQSTYSQAVGKAQRIDAFRRVQPEIEPPKSDTEGVAAAAAESAIFLEMGTSRMAAQPAMLPAAEAVRGKLSGIISKHVEKAINATLK